MAKIDFQLFPSVPSLYFICCSFIARAWFIAIIHIVSFNQKQSLLTIFYPNKTHFYIALILGLPAIITLVLNRYPGKCHKVLHIWAKPLLLLSLCVDISLQIQAIKDNNLHYSIATALLLSVSCWFCLWLITSKQLKECWMPELTIKNRKIN